MLGLGLNFGSSESGSSAARMGGPGLLLDTYSGAAAAYSLRKLNSSYTGKVVQLRRESDHVEVDVGFDANGLLSLDSPVTNVTEESTGITQGSSTNAAKLGEFCGEARRSGGDTSYATVDSMTEASHVSVVTWYDQSGNANDATQAAAASQPKVYDRTTGVVTRGGKPSVLFTGNTQILPISTSFNNNTYLYIGQPLSRSQGFGAQGKSVRTDGIIGYRNFVFEWAGANLYVLHNGTVYDATSGGNISVTLGFDVVLFRRGSVGTKTPDQIGYENTQYISEIVSYSTLESDSNLVGISNNANTFYSIY